MEALFGEGSVALELRGDEVIVPANSLTAIDVLANDLGLTDGDADNLFITEQPKCGRISVRDKQAQYQPSDHCVGAQTFSYTIHGRSLDQTGHVAVVVRLGTPTQSPVAANAVRDTTLPTPVMPRALAARAIVTPSLLPDVAAAVTVSAAIKPPEVPRPRIMVIARLLDTSAADGSMAAGVALDGLGLSPSITRPPNGLAEGSLISTMPVVPQPVEPPYLGALNSATQANAAQAIMVTAPAQPAMPQPLRQSM